MSTEQEQVPHTDEFSGMVLLVVVLTNKVHCVVEETQKVQLLMLPSSPRTSPMIGKLARNMTMTLLSSQKTCALLCLYLSSVAFMVSIFVVALQLVILSLCLSGLVKDNPQGNHLNVPLYNTLHFWYPYSHHQEISWTFSMYLIWNTAKARFRTIPSYQEKQHNSNGTYLIYEIRCRGRGPWPCCSFFLHHTRNVTYFWTLQPSSLYQIWTISLSI